ncbi:MAG: hypothetical protein HY899_08400 [Deltaproteobacteria bacterium]|nr:hypothetical protein [Deltaproteobacteria bacterium]
MKRLLQALALLQLALVVGLGLRVVDVLRTELPTFGEIPDLPAVTPLPAARSRAKPDAATTDAIVNADLFEAERGVHTEDLDVSGLADAAPLPPPTNVKVSGILLLGEPVAILSDPAVGPDQRSLRRGDMFGDYQVGEIGPSSVVLLGSTGQEFHLDLHVEGGSGGGGPAPGTPPRAAGATPARPTTAPGNRAATPRPGSPAAPADKTDSRAMSARERAQAIAQRNAAIRASRPTPGQAGATAPGGQGEAAAPDPVQARLDALRKLREAAKTR